MYIQTSFSIFSLFYYLSSEIGERNKKKRKGEGEKKVLGRKGVRKEGRKEGRKGGREGLTD